MYWQTYRHRVEKEEPSETQRDEISYFITSHFKIHSQIWHCYSETKGINNPM